MATNLNELNRGWPCNYLYVDVDMVFSTSTTTTNGHTWSERTSSLSPSNDYTIVIVISCKDRAYLPTYPFL